MDKQQLIDLLLTPFVCDPVRYLVAISTNTNPDQYFNEPKNSSQIHFVMATIDQFELYESALMVAAEKSERWKFLLDHYARYRHIFSHFDAGERSRAELEYLSIPAIDNFEKSLTA